MMPDKTRIMNLFDLRQRDDGYFGDAAAFAEDLGYARQ